MDVREGASDRKSALRLYCQRVLGYFELKGAQQIEADILQPAETLLDLYGEAIRATAYVTHDPLLGEMVLRPDFTLPVVRRHMERGASPARYCYSGEVFRVCDVVSSTTQSETMQVGYELFADTDLLDADAEVLAVVKSALDGFPVVPVIGDMSLLKAAIFALTPDAYRRDALCRHIARPKRLKNLLHRFGEQAALSPTREAVLDAHDPLSEYEEIPGLRSSGEIMQRIFMLKADYDSPAIPPEKIAIMQHLLNISGPIGQCVSQIRDVAVDLKHDDFDGAIQRMMRRFDAFSARGIAVDEMVFEANYSRSAMEYYDGFAFAFLRTDLPSSDVVATGGRYDQLTAALGAGASIPAVGGVIRPQALEDLLC